MSESNSLPHYRSVLVKISGESLASPSLPIDLNHVEELAQELAALAGRGIQVAVVMGGGNLWRGGRAQGLTIDRQHSDSIGMMATVMNTLALDESLQRMGICTRHFSALPLHDTVTPFDLAHARKLFQQGHLLLFSAGIGQPFFSTDTATALRASQLKVEVVFKATQVEGIYSHDPAQPGAVFYPRLSYARAIEQGLKVMDLTAFEICQQSNLHIRIFRHQAGALLQAACDLNFGSTLHP